MKTDPKPDLRPIEINIVEEKEWKWDSGGKIMDWASDNAWQDWRNLSARDCEPLVADVAEAGLTKKERARLKPEDFERICERMKEEPDLLESLHLAILDASQWMWEEAYIPDDGEIREAMELAEDDFTEDLEWRDVWKLVVGERPLPFKGPLEWRPKTFRWTEHQAIREFLKAVSYRRKPGHYDRYLVFEFGTTAPVLGLLEAIEKKKALLRRQIDDMESERGGLDDEDDARRDFLDDAIEELKDESEELDHEVRELKQSFLDWVNIYMSGFWKALDRVMERADPGMKTDWNKNWKAMLSDKQTMKAAGKEILEFVARPSE
jgi:hypothetical protein